MYLLTICIFCEAVLIFCPFLLGCYLLSFRVLDSGHISYLWYVIYTIYSPSSGLTFHFLTVFFQIVVLKVQSINFVWVTYGVISKKSLTNTKFTQIFSIFSFRSFYSFIFRSTAYFNCCVFKYEKNPFVWRIWIIFLH